MIYCLRSSSLISSEEGICSKWWITRTRTTPLGDQLFIVPHLKNKWGEGCTVFAQLLLIHEMQESVSITSVPQHTFYFITRLCKWHRWDKEEEMCQKALILSNCMACSITWKSYRYIFIGKADILILFFKKFCLLLHNCTAHWIRKSTTSNLVPYQGHIYEWGTWMLFFLPLLHCLLPKDPCALTKEVNATT